MDGAFLHIPANAVTLAGFRAWTESEEFPEKGVRATFINGEIYLDMSMEDLETHAAVKTETSWVLRGLDRDEERGKFYQDGVYIANVPADVSNKPDAVYFTWDSLDAGRVRLVPAQSGAEGRFVALEGTPDWLMGIVSNSSGKKDLQLLREAYHRAGVPEYWLIDARGDDLVFQILHWRKTGYAAAPNRDGWQRSRVFGRSFRLIREPGRRGLWRYQLEVQAEQP